MYVLINAILSTLKDVVKLKLPSSVFGSQYEEQIGLLNKAAPAHGRLQ